MAEIKKIIDELLKEEIGKHMCDSGGAYGYIYERNREKGYLTGMTPVEEYTDEDCKERTLEVVIPVYDFLTYNLEKDSETVKLEKTLMYLLKEYEINPYHIFEVQDFLQTHAKILLGITPTGLRPLEYVNTYNAEEYLSQTLLYCPFRYNGDNYIILEVHNGCDVRSGYTKPQVFKVKDLEYFIMGQSDRRTECSCGLNSYRISGYDYIEESDGWVIDKGLVYDRTFVDYKGNVYCNDCGSIVTGGFIEW